MRRAELCPSCESRPNPNNGRSVLLVLLPLLLLLSSPVLSAPSYAAVLRFLRPLAQLARTQPAAIKPKEERETEQ
jgi:hypothetical protein